MIKKVLFSLFILCYVNIGWAQETTKAVKKIDWITLAELEAKMQEEPRKVIFDLYTNWCGWCKRMDKATFEHPVIADFVNENYYAVKLNAERKDTIVFLNTIFEFIPVKRGGFNKLAYLLINGNNPKGRMSYPTIAFTDEKMRRINSFRGYKPPEVMDGLLHYILEGEYLLQPLESYQKAYKSPILPSEPKKPNVLPQKVPSINN